MKPLINKLPANKPARPLRRAGMAKRRGGHRQRLARAVRLFDGINLWRFILEN